MTMKDLRTAATELLPLDADRRVEAVVHLAFLAQAAVVPALGDAWRAPRSGSRSRWPRESPTRCRRASSRPPHAEHEAARLRVLLDGLRLQLVTTPRQTSAEWALAVLDDHLSALAQ